MLEIYLWGVMACMVFYLLVISYDLYHYGSDIYEPDIPQMIAGLFMAALSWVGVLCVSFIFFTYTGENHD